MTDLLFVYGTLRRGAGHPMHLELVRRSAFVGEGGVEMRSGEVLRAWVYGFKGGTHPG